MQMGRKLIIKNNKKTQRHVEVELRDERGGVGWGHEWRRRMEFGTSVSLAGLS